MLCMGLECTEIDCSTVEGEGMMEHYGVENTPAIVTIDGNGDKISEVRYEYDITRIKES